jgi:hypothetical protein
MAANSRYLQTAGQGVPPVVAAVTLLLMWPTAAAGDDWHPAGENRGVALESRPTADGYRAYRGAVTVCTDLAGLQRFVADASRLDEWIPFTEAARALPNEDGQQLYYLRTSAPWPFKSRDMVYRLTSESAVDDGTIHIRLEGLPDALPEQQGVVRMKSAEGRWALTPGNGHIHVELRLAANARRAPAFFADRRLAATVAGTLANLAEEFPCAGLEGEGSRSGSDPESRSGDRSH